MAEIDDAKIAETLRYAIGELNQAMLEAAEHGVRAELTVREYSRTGVKVAYQQISIRLVREL